MKKIKILFVEMYLWQLILIVFVALLLTLPVQMSNETKVAKKYILDNIDVKDFIGNIKSVNLTKAIIGARPGKDGVPSNEYTFYVVGSKKNARVIVFMEFLDYRKKEIKYIKIEKIKQIRK